MDNYSPSSSALAAWATFPISSDPRPLVLTGDTVELEGFKTGDAKLAFMEQNFISEVPLPGGLLARLGTPSRRSKAPALRITAANSVMWSFSTDRGKISLAAWDLAITDAIGPIHVMDPTIDTWWPPGIAFSPSYAQPSRISPDGMMLTYRFDGPPIEYYRVVSAEAIETPTAVLVEVKTELLPPAPKYIPGYAQRREAEVTLRNPSVGGFSSIRQDTQCRFWRADLTLSHCPVTDRGTVHQGSLSSLGPSRRSWLFEVHRTAAVGLRTL